MSSQDVRRGITNAHFNEQHSNILFGEVFLIAIVAGLVTKSWWVGGGTLAAFIIGLQFSFIAIPLLFILSLVWGAIGYGIGTLFESSGASWVIGIFAFLCGLGVHLAGLQWMKDIGSE
ncbi:TPA: hypothetical protein ACIS76_000480 [Salmonella enterica subsp. enterica serovar Saintpaul]